MDPHRPPLDEGEAPGEQPVRVALLCEREDWPAEKARLWDMFAATPPPVGYDPITFWPDGKEAPRFGVIRLIPWRIEVTSLADLMKGGGKIWQRE